MTIADDVARLADVATKLLLETERLQQDVYRLRMRIEPFANERRLPPPTKIEPTRRWRVIDALNTIEASRDLIRICEFHLAGIRAQVRGT
jgi:hypothetical protein